MPRRRVAACRLRGGAGGVGRPRPRWRGLSGHRQAFSPKSALIRLCAVKSSSGGVLQDDFRSCHSRTKTRPFWRMRKILSSDLSRDKAYFTMGGFPLFPAFNPPSTRRFPLFPHLFLPVARLLR